MNSDGAILVTGASGFIGKHMLQHLCDSGANAIGWTRVMGDLRDKDAVDAKLRILKPDCIFHLAARPASASNDHWATIADEQKMLTNLAYAMPAQCRLIYAGSMAEYGRSGCFDEQDYCLPDTMYGCAKFSCTNLAIALRVSLNLDIRVARLFGVYGPGEASRRLLPSLIIGLLKGETVPLSDGLQIRDFVHVDDVCSALHEISLSTDPAASMLNVGTGIGVPVRLVCEMVADTLGADRSLLGFGQIARRHVDQDILTAKIDKLSTIMIPPKQRWLSSKMTQECVSRLQTELADKLEF